MTRAEYITRYNRLQQRMQRYLWTLLPMVVVLVGLSFAWEYHALAPSRRAQADLRRQPRMEVLVRQAQTTRRVALVSLSAGAGIYLVLVGVMIWQGGRILAANAPRRDSCNRLLPPRTRGQVLASGHCSLCRRFAFTG